MFWENVLERHPIDGRDVEFKTTDGCKRKGFYSVEDFGARSFFTDKHTRYISAVDGGNVINWRYVEQKGSK